MSEAPVVRLDLPARPEGVGVVRQALVGVADGLALDGAVLADAKMAVTEACTNAVVHAYDEVAGRLAVEMFADERALTVVVRDHGSGIQPRANPSGTTALGLGLPLIAALSDAFEVRGGPGIGTEVRMTFEYDRDMDPVEENPITGGPGPSGRWDLDLESSPPEGGG
jgi:serine/threonine-protein kinase RsbW